MMKRIIVFSLLLIFCFSGVVLAESGNANEGKSLQIILAKGGPLNTKCTKTC